MPELLPPDPYKALGVSKDADLDDIRKVYRKLVLTCHPDKFPDEAVKAQKSEEFHKVQQAWELLNNPSEKAHYDKLCQLSRLRAELAAQGGARRASEDSSSRAAASPRVETRWNAVYEERVPKPRSRSRSFEKEYRDFDVHRPSTKKYEHDFPSPTSRRPSGRVAEGGRQDRREDDHKDREHIVKKRWEDAMKSAQRTIHADREKTRDRSRRQEYDSKHYTRSRVDSDSASESEVERFMSSSRRSTEPKKRHEESRRSRHEVTHARKSSYDSEYSDEREHKTYTTVQSAAEYISKLSGKPLKVEVSDRRRPQLPKHSSARTAVPPPPPPPPPPPILPIDTPRRSSASSTRRGSRTTQSTTNGKKIEIVDPPEVYEGRRPNLSSSTSSPAPIKILPPSPQGVPRAQTMEVRSTEKTPSPLRRSQTSPMAYPSPGHVPSKSSKLRNSETHDSGYSSPGTPEMKSSQTPQFTSTRYQYISEDDEDEGARTPRIIPIKPEYRTHERDRERDVSPRTANRVERSSHTRGSSKRISKRSQSYVESPRHPPTTIRSSTTKQEDTKSSRLFGEISQSPPRDDKYSNGKYSNDRYSNDRYSNDKHSKVSWSPEYKKSDIKYAEYPRSSGPDSAYNHRDRDAYAYESRSARSGHPSMVY